MPCLPLVHASTKQQNILSWTLLTGDKCICELIEKSDVGEMRNRVLKRINSSEDIFEYFNSCLYLITPRPWTTSLLIFLFVPTSIKNVKYEILSNDVELILLTMNSFKLYYLRVYILNHDRFIQLPQLWSSFMYYTFIINISINQK